MNLVILTYFQCVISYFVHRIGADNSALIMYVDCQFPSHFNSTQHIMHINIIFVLQTVFLWNWSINYRLVTFCIPFLTGLNKYLIVDSDIPNSWRQGMAWDKWSLISFTDTPHEVMVVSLCFSCALNPFTFLNSVAISGMLGKCSRMDICHLCHFYSSLLIASLQGELCCQHNFWIMNLTLYSQN